MLMYCSFKKIHLCLLNKVFTICFLIQFISATSTSTTVSLRIGSDRLCRLTAYAASLCNSSILLDCWHAEVSDLTPASTNLLHVSGFYISLSHFYYNTSLVILSEQHRNMGHPCVRNELDTQYLTWL